jgi:hypothetical protein
MSGCSKLQGQYKGELTAREMEWVDCDTFVCAKALHGSRPTQDFSCDTTVTSADRFVEVSSKLNPRFSTGLSHLKLINQQSNPLVVGLRLWCQH